MQMKKIFALRVISSFLIMSFIICSTESANPYNVDTNDTQQIVTFIKVFGGVDWDYAYSVQQTLDGGYIIAGNNGSLDKNGYDILLIKTDRYSNEEWKKTYNYSFEDKARNIQQTSDGGYITLGNFRHYEGGFYNIFLIKTDSFGNEQWNKTFDKIEGFSVQQTLDDGYILVGMIKNDIWLAKLDYSGLEKWNKTFGGSEYDCGFAVQQTSDDGYIVIGNTESYGIRFNDIWLIKFDFLGNVQWNRTFDGEGRDYGHSVQQTMDGGFILVGVKESWEEAEDDLWLIKTDSLGIEEWNQSFGGDSLENGRSVQQTTDGGYIITGDTVSYGAGGADVWLIKTDSFGNKQWDKTFGGRYGDIGESVQQTSDGGYIIVANTFSYSNLDHCDILLIKTDSSGNVEGYQQPLDKKDDNNYPLWFWVIILLVIIVIVIIIIVIFKRYQKKQEP
jgi:hypothetical protein